MACAHESKSQGIRGFLSVHEADLLALPYGTEARAKEPIGELLTALEMHTPIEILRWEGTLSTLSTACFLLHSVDISRT